MNLSKGLGTVLALMGLQLAGCKGDDYDSYDLVVEVRNEGTSPATIAVHYQEGETYPSGGEGDDYGVVHPGETWSRNYATVYQVNVEVRRSYDGLVLFSDSMRENGFDGVDNRWVIVVHP